jgi:hypothetical protein
MQAIPAIPLLITKLQLVTCVQHRLSDADVRALRDADGLRLELRQRDQQRRGAGGSGYRVGSAAIISECFFKLILGEA